MTIKPEVALFKQRKIAIRKEKNYYNKFIFNGHFSVFLLILLGAFIMGYGQWLRHIPQHIDYALITSFIVAITSIFPIRTLLKQADELFLLPFEQHMKTYVRLSLNYSFYNRIALQLIILVVLYPLFSKLPHFSILNYLIFVGMVFLHSYLGLYIRWQWYLGQKSSWTINTLLVIINILGYELVLGLNNYLGLLLTLLIVVSYIVLKKQNAVSLFPWERMIRIEQRHHTNYYKFVNMFTDVKHLKETAVRRRYLDPLLVTPKATRFNAKNMYLFLFTRSFVRGKDAFNIILRLIIIALILMIWLANPFVTIVIGCLFMYITLLQMSQFYTQQAYGLWPQVWPVPDTFVIRGYEQFLYRLMLVIGLIFSITFVYLYPQFFFGIIVFFLVGWLTIRSTIKKLKYQETLLRD
ncbi:ABC transporter permease [Staphylococcus lugdunensis]|uniref:ABC transporter permease n=1 Tax=Staphylococcus lugdunensis TaxID=28035 RepID=A0A4V2KVK1_STALU|nr:MULTISPECIES: ABC transporter permease [Staphylococcus]AMG60373.1 multidrug ABC transporter ATP-binding protein [Staphylococcus lugdunensis]ARJ11187.1 multidrug ABC transporter ATP-binding protein [Staphylococcus lugdunensis]AST60359.1 multidrug ABC transporter ATP-binding protein [Staphylococcus lugdunensis]ATG68610.1 multidrug ABC transporter ATP-binding protein [Staphylococcus lugdunensis]ATN13863.1 multidrug ABC transporter ATP-binding protein [Staphylococcus lugdunensis]